MGVLVDNGQRRIPVNERRLTRAAQRALAGVGRPEGQVDVAVVDDPTIRRLNRAHRGVARRTDVLAFPMENPQGAGSLVGQVVISADTAARQAHRLGVPLALELDLLVTHGVLHLVGYDDRDPVEAALMHRRERALLEGHRGRSFPGLWTGLLGPDEPGRALPRARREAPSLRAGALGASGGRGARSRLPIR